MKNVEIKISGQLPGQEDSPWNKMWCGEGAGSRVAYTFQN